MNSAYFTPSCIYALATAYQPSAIAVFRISGEGCVEKFNSLLKKPISLQDSALAAGKGLFFRSIYYKSEKIDEVVLSVFKKGHGYTREESIEVSCHGSIAVINALDEVFYKIGFRKAERGEFTFRAVASGALSLIESEAVLELIESDSESRRKKAIARLSGELDEAFSSIRKDIISILSVFELQMDYSEDEFDEDVSYPAEAINGVLSAIRELLSTFRVSKKEADGIKIVILGDTNEGKSTLFNALLGQSRSIVSSQRGTTRDYISESVEIAGQKVFLYDTAGFNDTAVGAEKAGIDMTNSLACEADIIIRLISPSQKPEDFEFSQKTIFVQNKSDITPPASDKFVIAISAKNRTGLAELTDAIEEKISMIISTPKGAVNIASERQRRLLEEAYDSLLSLGEDKPLEDLCIDTSNALTLFDQLLGLDDNSEAVMDEIFSRFCVGK